VNKRARQKFDLERFDLGNLDDVEVKSTGRKSQIDLLLWKSWMRIWTLIVLGEVLEQISRAQQKKI
jgi:hypothetical protein